MKKTKRGPFYETLCSYHVLVITHQILKNQIIIPETVKLGP